MSGRAYIVVGCAVALTTLTAVAAGARNRATPPPVFAAASVLKYGPVKQAKCGAYVVTRGTYAGRASSVDARLAGSLFLRIKVSERADGSGLASGKLTVRDKNRKLRASANLNGVVNNHAIVGLLSAKLFSPNARLLANTVVAFDPRFTIGGVRIGLGPAANAGVVFGKLPKC